MPPGDHHLVPDSPVPDGENSLSRIRVAAAMWSLFRSKPSCPVGQDERAWIGGWFSWLSGQFGPQVPNDAVVVLPTPEFFPDPYHSRPEDVPPLFSRVCDDLGLDPARFGLSLYSEADRPRLVDGDGRPIGGTARLDQGGDCPVVWVEYSMLADPPAGSRSST